MKKQYETSEKARSSTGWHVHLRKSGKRAANKGTRRLSRVALRHECLAGCAG